MATLAARTDRSGGPASVIGAAFEPVGRRGLVLDALVALVLTGLIIASTVVFTHLAPASQLEPPSVVTFVAGAAMCLSLALRRVYPLTVFVVVAVTFTVYGMNQGYDAFVSSVALFVATVSAGSHGRAGARDWARGLVIAGLFGSIFYVMFVEADNQAAPLLALWLGPAYVLLLNVFYFAAAWVFGDQIRLRRENERRLAERTAELEVERDLNAERAAIAERLRIARELHDTLGHHVSTMGLQAAGAERVLDGDPERARASLTAIQESSRRAVDELQGALRLLRDDGDDAPSLTRLTRIEELADEVRRSGVEVTIQVEESLPPLRDSVDLAATRVIQEALTNVLRHAGPGSCAWVRVRTDDGTLRVVVEDDGRGRPSPQAVPGSGTGLTGMTERVELHGGEFEAGPRDGGGFRVAARLPLSEAGQEPAGMTR